MAQAGRTEEWAIRHREPLMSTHSPLVSVVTPVYNGEPFLRECIESVLAQTYPYWDYTIVNNCSTDRSLEIAREYAAKDPRIRIHNNETFLRVVANYNNALRHISPDSKYCKVIAADDWLFPECLQKMVDFAEEHSSVGVVASYTLFGTKVMYDDVLPYPTTIMPGWEACRARLLGSDPHLFGAASLGLFRADIVRPRPSFYNESNLHGDTEACFALLEHHDLGFVHQVLAFRREHEGAMSSFANRTNSYAAGRLSELMTYGPRCLTEAEQARRLRESLRKYYHYLATQVLERREPQFWSFHRKKLAEVGLPLSRARVAAHVGLYILGLLLHPRATAERSGRRLRRILHGRRA
jgi:glycosyltransferase involved in cell wall biosynthesis